MSFFGHPALHCLHRSSSTYLISNNGQAHKVSISTLLEHFSTFHTVCRLFTYVRPKLNRTKQIKLRGNTVDVLLPLALAPAWGADPYGTGALDCGDGGFLTDPSAVPCPKVDVPRALPLLHFCGAKLIPLVKNAEGVRPIACSAVIRRYGDASGDTGDASDPLKHQTMKKTTKIMLRKSWHARYVGQLSMTTPLHWATVPPRSNTEIF